MVSAIEIERHMIESLIELKSHNIDKIKKLMYDKTKQNKLMSNEIIKSLLNRYKISEFKLINILNEHEENEIRKGNYESQIKTNVLVEGFTSSDISLDNYLYDVNHILYKENIDIFADFLRKNDRLIIFPGSDLSVRSKTAELIRLLLNLPVRRWDGSQYRFDSSISAVKYHPQIKKSPKRNQAIDPFISEIINEMETSFEKNGKKYTYMTIKKSKYNKLPFIKSVKSVLKGFQNFISTKYGIDEKDMKLSEFQCNCIKETIRSSYVENYTYPDHLIITAGVASGKTFGFLLGMMICILYIKIIEERRGQKNPKTQCILIYPRVSLSKDQADTIESLITHVNHIATTQYNIQSKITSVSDFGSIFTNTVGSDGKKGVYYNLKKHSAYNPDIWITNTETIRRRIKNPCANFLFTRSLSFIILDEIHLYESIGGIHLSKLLQRIIGRCSQNNISKKHTPMFVGSSATIAEPLEHCSKLFSESQFEKIQHVSADDSEHMADYGVFQHILIKAKEGRSLIGTLTDLTSCVTHTDINELPEINSVRLSQKLTDVEEKQLKQTKKVVGFSDSLRIVSRWKDLLRDQERTLSNKFWSNGEFPPNPWSRDFPFYGMFFKPLVSRTEYLHDELIKRSAKKSDIMSLNDEIIKLCNKCKDCSPYSIAFSNYLSGDPLQYLLENILVPYPSQSQIQDDIGILNACPFFNKGLCWWFSLDSTISHDLFESTTGNLYHIYGDNIRTKISTSKIRESIQNPNEEFTSDFYTIFNSKYIGNNEINLNKKLITPFIISSPVLEVGVDITNVSGVILHKALRNLSSYKQKIGRAGREVLADSYAVSLISFDPRESYYYRNSFMLSDPSILDPIPLKRKNLDLDKSHALAACYDYFSGLGQDIINIRPNTREFDINHVSLSERIKLISTSALLPDSNGKIKDTHLLDYLTNFLLIDKKTSIDSVDHFKKHIEVLNSKNVSKYINSSSQNLASLCEELVTSRQPPVVRSTIQIDHQSLNKLRELYNQYNEYVGFIKKQEIKEKLQKLLEEL